MIAADIILLESFITTETKVWALYSLTGADQFCCQFHHKVPYHSHWSSKDWRETSWGPLEVTDLTQANFTQTLGV
jgi:hypothetical protein